MIVVAVAAVVATLSYRPVANLLSRHQMMNTTFDPLRLVNSYGAFGSVTRVRREVVVEGTTDEVLTSATVWREYEFKAKPGDPRRRPRQIAPYHLRIDWLMWFLPLSPRYGHTWFRPFLARLLTNDADTIKLLRTNPFPTAPPAYVRARLYRYRFTTGAERRATGAWWHRDPIGDYVKPQRLPPAAPSHLDRPERARSGDIAVRPEQLMSRPLPVGTPRRNWMHASASSRARRPARAWIGGLFSAHAVPVTVRRGATRTCGRSRDRGR